MSFEPAAEWIVRLIIGILIAFRLTELVVFDDGPFDLCYRFRTWVGVYNIGEDDRPRTNLGRLVACPYCFGVYAAGLLAIILAPSFSVEILALWGAIAGGQSVLQSLVRRPE